MSQSYKKLRALGVIFAFACLSGCASLNPFAAKLPSMSPIDASMKINVVWKVNLGADSERYVFTPALLEGQVIAAAANGYVTRLDENGSQLWRVRPSKTLSAGVGTNGTLVVVANENGEIIALNAADGTERWRTKQGVEIIAPPAVNGDTVVVRTSDNRLMGLEVEGGARRWVYQRSNPALAMRSSASMLIDADTAVTGFPGGKLAGVATRNGELLWELNIAQARGTTELERMIDVAGSPLAARGELCAVAYQGRVSCFDFAKGSLVWSVEFSSVVGLARDNFNVFAISDKGIVTALDNKTGAQEWKTDVI